MAYLSRIDIYPVKSLDGVSVQNVRVLPSGALADDRRYAIFDGAGNYVNGKRNARVHLLRSRFDPAAHTLTLAAEGGGEGKTFHVDAERKDLEEWLGGFFGFAVTFRENGGGGFPDDTDSPGPTLISTATLREIAEWFGLTLDQVRARFRTNLEIDGVPAFWEDRLYGQRGVSVRFRLGQAVFDGINPCQRCVVPTRDAATGSGLPEFARRFVEMRRTHLPNWAERSRFNHFYRVAINTKLAEHQPGLTLGVGDRAELIGQRGTPQAPAPAGPSRWSGRLRIAGIVELTPNVKTFRLVPIDGGRLPFTYLPGQHLNIAVSIDGVVHRRCYTIASSPTRPEYCEITMKREESGVVSRFLHDAAGEGTEIEASGPGGKFTFTGEEADALLLIGGGVGITPLMSVVRYLTDRKWGGRIELLYCARTHRDIIFRDELEELSRRCANLRITTTLTRQSENHWPGHRGRITPEMLRNVLPPGQNRRVHICGPLEMAGEVSRMLQEAGVGAEQIKSEAFGGSIAAVADHNGKAVIGAVTFSESAKSACIRAGQTILDAATCAGISIDRGCLSGICGRCKVRLVSGDVRMEVDEALSDTDKREGFVLACQARPAGNVAVDA
ncbi:MAG TPA: 2Fe-2S iron-sulfur cluster-binding protein [Tepidisphaeraceae bacterium]|nr:2Fe-2S iron-sulfur cluster-binding protein [Tepidisphaeraceae bacterium]